MNLVLRPSSPPKSTPSGQMARLTATPWKPGNRTWGNAVSHPTAVDATRSRRRARRTRFSLHARGAWLCWTSASTKAVMAASLLAGRRSGRTRRPHNKPRSVTDSARLDFITINGAFVWRPTSAGMDSPIRPA